MTSARRDDVLVRCKVAFPIVELFTARGCGSTCGPLLIAHLRQASGSYISGLHLIAGIMARSILLPALALAAPRAKGVRPPFIEQARRPDAIKSGFHPAEGVFERGALRSEQLRA